MEKNTNNPFHIDMDKLEYIFSATASALYGTTKEAQLFVKRMLFKTSCARIAATHETRNFNLVMRELNVEKNGLGRILKYIRFLNPHITEGQIFVIESGYDEYKKLYKQVKGHKKEEKGIPILLFFVNFRSLDIRDPFHR